MNNNQQAQSTNNNQQAQSTNNNQQAQSTNNNQQAQSTNNVPSPNQPKPIPNCRAFNPRESGNAIGSSDACIPLEVTPTNYSNLPDGIEINGCPTFWQYDHKTKYCYAPISCSSIDSKGDPDLLNSGKDSRGHVCLYDKGSVNDTNARCPVGFLFHTDNSGKITNLPYCINSNSSS